MRHPRSFALVLVALSAVAGCAEENPAFFIAGNVAADVGADGCEWQPNSDQFVARGMFDISDARSDYVVYPLYRNLARDRTRGVVADTNGLFVLRLEVQVSTLDGDFFGYEDGFTIPTSTFVPSSRDGTTPGAAVGRVPVITDGTVRSNVAAGTTLQLAIRAVGETLGGTEVRSGQWFWFVDVCDGCLLRCPPEGTAPTLGCDPGTDMVVFDEAFCEPDEDA